MSIDRNSAGVPGTKLSGNSNPALLQSLNELTFDNRFTQHLPVDPIVQNQRRQVAGACSSRVMPKQMPAPKLVAYAREVGALLDLNKSVCESDQFLQVFSGNEQLPGMDPYAMCYGGHQFGNWAGQLGDGRAINLGEIINSQGDRWALQLKGAGPTPYSRTADGLAVLRSSIREFLCSEAMHHLGVPTTRALCLIETGEKVMRDVLYDGHPQFEPGAIVCRVAPSFLRFGSFQLPRARNDEALLRQLVDYCIETDFPEIDTSSPDKYSQWFEQVCRTTGEMIAWWQCVGFVHGVMNTDNMSILGLTIDYGPYGWLEGFDPGWTPNTTDAQGRRYRYGHQPQIAQWNLEQLANAIFPLFDDVEPLQQGLTIYGQTFNRCFESKMAAKLGLFDFKPEMDTPLMDELHTAMQVAEIDMTIFYRCLSNFKQQADLAATTDSMLIELLADAFYSYGELTSEATSTLAQWLRSYNERLKLDGRLDTVRRESMNAVNPKFVLRNYLAQLAIDKAEQGDFNEVNALLDVLRHPYDEQPNQQSYAEKRPEWARHKVGCSMLSCSS